MVTTPHLEPIPHPPGHLLVCNLFDLDTSHPLESLADLARQYGPIYQLQLPGRGSRVIVSGYKLVDELCDETRFDKMLGPGLNVLGEGPVGRGLFTSETSDPNWHKAHNVLLPAFSLDAMRSYFPGMLDLAVQLMQKWERLNPDDTVDVPADMTRLTLDAAFSREPGQPKTYMQQAIRERADEVWRLLQHEALIFVCGEASRMAPDVRQAVAGLFQERTGTSASDAQAWLTGLMSSQRYLEDIWASAT